METAAFASVLRRRAWLVVLAACIAAAAAYFVSREAAPTYRASATALIVSGQQAGGQVLGQDQLIQLTNTYRTVAQTKAVIRRAERALPRGERDAFAGAVSVRSTDPGLLEFAAGARTGAAAARYAGTYATAFGRYVAQLGEEQRERTLRTIRRRVTSLQRQLSGSGGEGRASLQAQLQTLRTKISEVATTPGDSSRVIEPATVPGSPAEPRPLRNAVVAALVALAAALAALYLRFTASGRYVSGEEVAADIGLPLLGSMPRSASHRPASIESFNSLRTRLLHSLAELRNGAAPAEQAGDGKRPYGQTLLITSAERSVGKSHVAAHLARAFASSGVTVVAVDGDLRRPRLSEEFQLEGQRGLADATRTPAGDDGWAVGHVASMGGRLYAVSAGQQVEDPVATLGSPRTEQALARLRGDHDVIVIDTPPVLGVADTLLLSRTADGVALVVDIKQSRRRSVRRAVAVLREINAPLLGVVINSVDADAPYGYPARRGLRLGPRGAFAALSVVLCLAAAAVVLLGIVDIAGR